MPEKHKKTQFDKPALTLDQQLDRLIERGLEVPDREKALHYLRFIGYYRLSGYTLPFQHNDPALPAHTFRDGVAFDAVLDLYIFDRELRLLVMDAIERIEVAVRVAISNTMSERYGPHWYLDKTLFRKQYRHDKLLDEIRALTRHSAQDGTVQHKKRETFIQHYFKKYHTPELPPSWMVAEVLSIGTWSIVYSNLEKRSDRKAICAPFPLSPWTFHSWLHAIAYLRNLCAHHSRLWNRRFTITPEVPKEYKPHMSPNMTFRAQAAMLHILLNVIAPDSRWQHRLYELLQKHPDVPPGKMGFADDWQRDPFWGLA